MANAKRVDISYRSTQLIHIYLGILVKQDLSELLTYFYADHLHGLLHFCIVT